MSVDLRHLRVFLALAEELHFGRTALRLRVAQSAVSSTLKALEESVGATLLARTRRSVALTAAGRGFLDHARRAVDETEAATRAARRAAQGETGSLSLSFTLMSALTVLPRIVVRFQQLHPEVHVTIGSGGTTEQLEAIRVGRVDIGFVARKNAAAPLAAELVEESPLVVVMAKNHAFAGRRRLAMHQIAGERLVFLQEASEPHVVGKFRQLCNAHGFEPNIVLEVNAVETLLAFVAAGIGIACVPALFKRLAFRDIRAVPLTPTVRGGISAVWDPQTLTPVGARFLELMREERRKKR